MICFLISVIVASDQAGCVGVCVLVCASNESESDRVLHTSGRKEISEKGEREQKMGQTSEDQAFLLLLWVSRHYPIAPRFPFFCFLRLPLHALPGQGKVQ